MKARKILVRLAAAGLLTAIPALAEHTRYWRQSEFSEFEKGTAKGVALRSDGNLMPAPRFASFSDPNLAYLWALQADSRGRLYAAGGSDAKVIRFDDAGKPTTVFESPELAAQAIAFDARDNLYVGTSPDGKVYRVTPDGQKTTFFEPKTKYIWALGVDRQGTLFVATGDSGQVFAVNGNGEGKLFYQSDERHARSLAFDSKGNLLIGTEPNGLILRIPIERKNPKALPEAGASFVLYETAKKEVTSLLVKADGTLFAASIGEKPKAPGVPPVIPGVIAPQPQPANAQQPGAAVVIQAATPVTFPFIPAATGGSEVVQISVDGSPNVKWTSRDDLVYAMGFSAAGRVLLGTGNKGNVIELEQNRIYSSIAKTAAEQVTFVLAGREGKIYVATANPGKIFTLGPGFESEGSFESETFDAKIFSHWGRLTWWGENGATQGKVAFYLRSGNTSLPEKNWSPWAGPYKNPSGESVNCPAARFIQWKAVFLETDQGAPPTVSWVSIAFQPKNVAPEIDDIVVQEPGIRVQGFPQPTAAPGAATPVQLKMPQKAAGNLPAFSGFPAPGSTATEGAGRPAKIEPPPQGFEDKGFASVLWSAHDDNDDDLVFSIYFRGEGEQNWRLLKDKVTQKFYSWDTTTMPDGAYYLKIVASDSPSNPAHEALSAERTSERFEIANTPPRIEKLQAKASGGSADVTFEGVSASGALSKAQYSVDAGDWELIFPTGLLADAPRESYRIELAGLAAGEHTISVQVSDRFNNTTASKVTFRVSGHASN